LQESVSFLCGKMEEYWPAGRKAVAGGQSYK
jgi:hypothetical protein